jgi:hypothetical protein
MLVLLKVCGNEPGCRKGNNDILEEEEEDSSSDREEEVPLKPTMQVEAWKEESFFLNGEKTPTLAKLFNGHLEQPKHMINTLFMELVSVLGDGTTVDFLDENGKKGQATVVPQVRTQAGFMEQAHRLQWIDSMLNHIAGGDSNVLLVIVNGMPLKALPVLVI